MSRALSAICKAPHWVTMLSVSVLFFVFSATSAHAAIFTVTKTADTADGTCAMDCSLREAVIAANADGEPSTINVPASETPYMLTLGSSGEDLAAEGDLDITAAVTITGGGMDSTIVDGNANDRVFQIIGATTTIEDLTIQNGRTSVSGNQIGAGIKTDSSLTLSSVKVTQNVGANSDIIFDAYGIGIVCSSGGKLDISDSIISDNVMEEASQNIVGGGIYNSSNCDVDVARTTFSGNEATGAAAMYLVQSASVTHTFTDVTFDSNVATSWQAGAIFLIGDSDSVAAEFTNVTFDSNTANGGTGEGGAMFIQGPANFTNTTFDGNTSGLQGGALYIDNADYADVVFAQSTLTNNTATGNGGAFFIAGSNPSVTIKGSIIASNTSAASGDQCFAAAGITAFDYSLISDETDCSVPVGTGNVVNADMDTYFDSVLLADNGGPVQTVGGYGVSMTDLVPEAECDDADGNPLIVDARGLTRPEHTSCDIGAFELDQTNPVVVVTAGTDTVECSVDVWVDAGATATDNFATDITASVTSGSVTEETVGLYPIGYTSSIDYDGNAGTNTRTVTVQDTLGPTITVVGDSVLTHEAGTVYTDAGATAIDTCIGSADIETSGSVDVETLGEYTLTYSSTDDSTNSATPQTRTVTVEDTIVPTITLVGESAVTITAGDAYVDDGATAEDTFEGDITSSIVVDNPLDVNTPDEYTITYNVSDSSGNPAEEVSRTVTVIEPVVDSTPPVVTVSTNGKSLKVKVDGEVVDHAKINNKKYPKKFRKVLKKSIFHNYVTVAVLTVGNTKAKLTVFRLTSGNQLKKKVVATFTIAHHAKAGLKIKKSKKRITVIVGKGDSAIRVQYKLTKKGKLKPL